MTAVPLHAAYDIPKGTVLGKYEVLRKIATGGMAEIYAARVRGTAGFEKLVVLKRILPNVAQDPSFVQMFLAEARLAATLQHANIADVYDVGEADGTYFFTMEFVHGEDAREIRAATKRRGERPPLAIALAIVQGTAAALDYAHEKAGPQGPLGLVHRDISASNILVSYDGAVKLVDFGIARATASEHKTRTGTLKGKIPYMSPEQCRGQPLDRRSDLFSLGIVLYELTVGRRPFRGENDFQMMEQIVHFDARPPTEIDPDYPPELEAIVLKLLARDVKARYQTADRLLHDLEELARAKGLWASAKTVGKYMRSLFAEKIEAWESAERDGITLGQHVLGTTTHQSHPSSSTPSSFAVQALPPAVLPATGPFQLAEPSTGPSAVLAPPVMPVAPAPSRRGWIIALAAVATLVAVGGGYYAMRGGAAVETKVEPTVMPSAEPVAPPVARPPTIAPPEVATPPPAAASKPAVTKTTDESVAKSEPPVATKAEKPIAAKPEPPAATNTEPPKSAATAKPAAAKIDKRPPVVQKKPATSPKKKSDEPVKEKTWDPNSPFLPPSS